MDGATAGHAHWKEVRVHGGKIQGEMVGAEGFRSIITDEIVVPKEGWNGEPPPSETTACSRHQRVGSDEFWRNLAQAPLLGKVVRQENGRTILRY